MRFQSIVTGKGVDVVSTVVDSGLGVGTVFVQALHLGSKEIHRRRKETVYSFIFILISVTSDLMN